MKSPYKEKKAPAKTVKPENEIASDLQVEEALQLLLEPEDGAFAD